MWGDAILAYLHFIAIFVLFAFLVAEAMLLRGALGAEAVRLLGRVDVWYLGAAIAVLVTGLLRLELGAKGPAFYLHAWPVYAKLATFAAVALLSLRPTRAFIRWRRAGGADPGWRVPPAEARAMRRLVMIEVHLASAIPFFAVMMARGLGY